MKIKIFVILALFFSLELYSQNSPPKLSNFRIDNADRSKVYFESSKIISGSSENGFVISGKTVNKLNIIKGQTTGHYFEVSQPFTYWDNNTIRYSGGSDIEDKDGNALENFTLSYIQNNIKINESGLKQIYVNSSVTKSGNGTSEEEAFKTLQEGINALTRGGGKIWVKAGKYKEGEISNTVPTADKIAPYIIEGYKKTPGDISSMYYKYNRNANLKNLDPNEMPLFDGVDRENNTTFYNIASDNYLIWRNIQVTNYKVGFRAASMTGFVAENILIKDMGSLNSGNGYGFKMESNVSESNLIRIKNSIVINATHTGIKISGQHGLIENTKVYCNEALGSNDIKATTDYYYLIAGSDNIIRNSVAYKDTPNGWGHNGHGFSLKTQKNLAPVQYNLIEFCTAINIYGSFQARHINCKYNVFKDSEAHANVPNRMASSSDQRTGGIQFISGGSYNIFERLYIHDVDVAISWIANGEWDTDVNIQQNSIIRNCVFDDIKVAIRAYHSKTGGTSKPSGNKVFNCTFNNIDAMYRMVNDKPFQFTGNEFKNVIFNNIPIRDSELPFNGGWSYEYSNFYNTWTTEKGKGNISLSPGFENESNGNFRLKSNSSMIDKGQKLKEVTTDFENNTRSYTKSHDIGAYEYQGNKTVSIKADAGEDQTICFGEEITLIANGGSTYLWSTGATTKSIRVSPSETMIYSVKVTEGNDSDSDEVQVNVNKVVASAGEDVVITEGDVVTLTASGGSSYLWSNGETGSSITVSPISTTKYSVRVTDKGCEAFDEITVEVNNRGLSSVAAYAGEDQTICLGEKANLSATGGNSYLWSTGETTKSINVSPSATTNYTVTVSDGNTTDIDTVTIVIENCESSVSDIFDISKIKVFPNPTTGILNLQSNSSNPEVNVHLINVNGKILYQERLKIETSGFSKQLDLSNFTKGIYFVRFIKSEVVDVKKIVLI